MKRSGALLFCFLLFACSMQGRKEQADLRDLFKRGQTAEALIFLEKSEIKKDKKQRLLYLLQKGKILYAQEKYNKAGETFVQAGQLMDKLYTKSVKEAVLSGVANENSKTYYGSPYERSLLFYYQGLSFLNVYQNGFVLEKKPKEKAAKEKADAFIQKKLSHQEKRMFLLKARASMLAWDTFYSELQRSSRESTFFDHDLFAKILGAKVHEFIGEKNDLQIALQLYKDAYDILLKTGPAFKSFNSEFDSFAKALKDRKPLDEKEIKASVNYTRTKDFLIYKILSLAKTRQSWKLKALKKKLEPSKEILSRLKETNNVTVLVESGLVAPLLGEDFAYNLASAIESVESPAAKAFIAGVGVPVLTYFAMGPLGLGAVSSSGNSKLYVRHGLGEAATSQAGIEFEIPVIKEPKEPGVYELVVFKGKGEKKEEVARTPMSLAGPISDLAYQMNLERASNSFAKRGSRIAVKHVIAIIAAYKTYQAVQKASGELFAKPAAFAQYLVSAKAIKESERADTRQWSVLPSEVFLAELQLSPGKYWAALVESSTPEKSFMLGELEVGSTKADFFSYRRP